jgi:DNA-binding response OmpR family regulator
MDKIIFNILSNGFKFTKQGGAVHLYLNVSNGLASIRVADTGDGISEEYLPYVFDRFYDHKNPPGLEGSGIGLYLSKRLTETHKGNIRVISEKGKGTEFHISIPVKKTSYADNEIINNSQSSFVIHEIDSEEVPSVDLDENSDYGDNHQTILVVDDDREMVSFLTAILAKKYHVRIAANGKEALNIAREKFPNLIVSDLLMPEMDGLELCIKIKSDSLINHIPVIILTAKTGIENQIEGINAGADAYIAKPFDNTYLESVVENLLHQRENLRKRFSLESSDFEFTGENSAGGKFINKATQIIEQNLSNPDFSIEELGHELNMSRSQLFRKFRSLINMSPSDFIRITRLKKAAMLILKEDIGINQVAWEVGFTSPSHFITSFKKFFGTTPKLYIAAKRGTLHL